ncbi:hypothetical protein [uncultured Thiodictyon sp.]|uniref:hypothetical protein n=1 Tax=uncultured Thiodictyon sp. TaxID=1846217 RepID=UPI0025F65C81|nr:hypothetical protein [uncultured Thiodictyon sp.]
MAKKWKLTTDPLYRGDSVTGVASPTHGASPSLVRHILYLEGHGRETPYLSCTESDNIAVIFAGKNGKIYQTSLSTWKPNGVSHRSRKELLALLKGKGHGQAAWSSAFEVMRANQYVEEHLEHLADFTDLPDQSAVDQATRIIFRVAT